MDMMSSKDRGEEGEEQFLKVKVLPWRAELVNKMFTNLDMISKKDKSPYN